MISLGNERGWLRRSAVAAATAVVLAGLVAPAGAAGADFDPTFDGDGKVVSDFGFDDTGEGVAIQADGRIVVAGTSCGGDFLVARYLPGGAPDPSFDGDGRVCVDVNHGSADQGQQVVVLPDGRLLVAGTSGSDFAVVRLTATGGIDPTFGTSGGATYDLGGTDVLRDADVAPDGKIVLTGETTGAGCAGPGPTRGQTVGVAVVRTSADGVLDAGFGAGGKAVQILESQVQRGHAAAVGADGSIVVAGRTASCSRVVIGSLVYRLTPAGSPDPSFAAEEVLEGPTTAVDVALQPNGKVVVLVDSFFGPATSPSDDDAFTVVRYDSTGHADPGFGTGGVALALFGDGTDATPRALALQGDRIVAGGAAGTDTAVARFTSGGTLDGSFDGDGMLVADIGGVDLLAALAVQPDARLVGAGRSDSNLAVVRIGTPPPPPPTTPPPTVVPPTTVPPESIVCGILRQLAAVPLLGFLTALFPRFGCRP